MTVLSQTLIPYDGQDPRASTMQGASLIKPDSNLNWTTLGYGDVHLAYYNFLEHNNKYPIYLDADDNPSVSEPDNLEAIGAMFSRPRGKFSEGYYYFATLDTTRPTVGELLESISPGPGVENSNEMREAKEEAATNAISELTPQAIKIILEYAGKQIPDDLLSFESYYIAPVAQNLSTRGGENNARILFAMPAQVVDALPNSKNIYYNDLNTDLKDTFNGKDYTFTIKISVTC